MQRFDERFFLRSKESWDGISPKDFLSYLKPKIVTMISEEELISRLGTKKTLRVKFGIDPTGFDVHLGHLVPIMVLRQFMKAGHTIDFVIGDFTALIGDPSGRETARVPLTKEQIDENKKTYIDQVSRFIDTSKLQVSYNSAWLNIMTLDSLLPVLQSVSLSDAFQREDFRARFKNAQAVSLAEAVYGALMGLDSVHLETDVELGGVDQLLNFQQCRLVQEYKGMEKEIVCTTPILEGTSGDGKKMSKSYGNYISVTASPAEKFGKIMSIPDALIAPYMKSFADIRDDEVKEFEEAILQNPFELKKQLGVFLVALETGSLEAGEKEREEFERKFSQSSIEEGDAISVECEKDASLFEALFSSGLFESKTELRRLFEQKAVRLVVDDHILSAETKIEEIHGVVRVGKMKFFTFSLK